MDLLKNILSFCEARGARRRRTVNTVVAECLETRRLLTIADIHFTYDSSLVSPGTLSWNDSGGNDGSRYEIWLDHHVSTEIRNAKIYYETDIPFASRLATHQISQHLAAGEYSAFIRRHDADLATGWIRHQFEIDDDDNPNTEIDPLPPARPEFVAVRQGQGAAGQKSSEDAIQWTGDSLLYNVWLGKRSEGARTVYSVIRNVPRPWISFSELEAAAPFSNSTYFSDVSADTTPRQLQTGDYELFVRGVNGAVSEEGRWVGQGAWSQGVSFSFHRVEGTDAIPDALTATHEVRPAISWAPVPHAEAYLVSLWKGPDYQNHSPLNIRVNGTRFKATNTTISDGQRSMTVEPGDEVFVRVRAIGSGGMLEGLRAGNFAYTTIRVPQQLISQHLSAPVIEGPAETTGDTMPVLRWQHSMHAEEYEIWFSSLETRRRVFLAGGITDNVFHLSPEGLSQYSDLSTSNQTAYTSERGLVDGRYRFWVRSRNAASDSAGPWSRSYDFDVSSDRITTLQLNPSDDPAIMPLVSPNLVRTYTEDGQPYLLLTTGQGESFGASVLARYSLDENGLPSRPVVTAPETGQKTLQFPDLPMGSNVADIEFLDDHRVIVLSRGSNDLHVVDLLRWQTISRFALDLNTDVESPDAIDLEVLSNGQVMVVFNRSNRLRVFDVDSQGRISEKSITDEAMEPPGFLLNHGRAVQVSSIATTDGQYKVFLATPAVAGVVSATYDPDTMTLQIADVVVSRDSNASPYIGGQVITVPSTTAMTAETFYLSTDRNGFLTWLNTDTFSFGFVDIVDFIPDSSRDANDKNYRDPDDNHVDPIQIVKIDENNIAVVNNRDRSVILTLDANPDGALEVTDSSTFNGGYGAAIASSHSDLKLFTTAGGDPTVTVGAHNVFVNNLEYRVADNSWYSRNFTPVVLATPVDRGLRLSGNEMFVEYAGGGRSVIYTDSIQSTLEEVEFPQSVESVLGEAFDTAAGPVGTYTDAVSRRRYLAIHTTQPTDDPLVRDHFLSIVDITTPSAPQVQSTYPMPSTLRWYSVEMNSHEVVVLDRLAGEATIIGNWTSPQGGTVGTYRFDDRHADFFGGSRPAQSETLSDGTKIFMHDTVPDKVITVFPSGEWGSETPLAQVHTNNVGQWAFDMHVMDDDRIVFVTWDARLVVLNVRTGVLETSQQLDALSNTNLDLYGARSTSFNNGTLSVSSPAAGIVAEFQVESHDSGVGFDATLTRISRAPAVVATILTPTAHWRIESTSVSRSDYQ